MQHKKIDFTKKLKLSAFSETESQDSSLKIIKRRESANTVSFRLRRIDLDRLLETLENANQVNESHHFNRTDLIRGLILLGTELDSKKVLQFIRQSI